MDMAGLVQERFGLTTSAAWGQLVKRHGAVAKMNAC
jgi:hypothetical protein